MGKTKIGVTITVAVLVTIIAVYAAGPLFFDVTVNEEMPVASITIRHHST